MSKDTKFSIHDWQAKQRRQLLNEIYPTEPIGDFMSQNIDKLKKLKTTTTVAQPLNADDLDRLKHFRDNLDDMMYDAGYSGDWILKIKTILRGIIDSNVNEASMTGTGTSITTGDSMAYATPKAFKKKRKED